MHCRQISSLASFFSLSVFWIARQFPSRDSKSAPGQHGARGHALRRTDQDTRPREGREHGTVWSGGRSLCCGWRRSRIGAMNDCEYRTCIWNGHRRSPGTDGAAKDVATIWGDCDIRLTCGRSIF
jgi:hypothetical protein